jgi:hypothetical protein
MRLPLKTQNLLLILLGSVIIGIGYLLMSTEKFVDATEFSLSLHVSPVLFVIGHVVVVIGILMRFKKKDAGQAA